MEEARMEYPTTPTLPEFRARKHARSTSTAKTAVITKKKLRKRNLIGNSLTIEESDEEFLLPFKKRPRRSGSYYSVRNSTKRRSRPDTIYQISDSSDDEPINIPNDEDRSFFVPSLYTGSFNLAELEPHFFCASTSKDNKPTICTAYRGTSNKDEAGRHTSIGDGITQFIDNLLDTGDNFIKENFIKDSGLKSLKDLNDETDKLLASSLDLINKDTSSSNVDDSVIYLCTHKYPMAQQVLEDKSSEIEEAASVDLTKQKDQDEQNKPSCAICLEVFARNAVASTICGHIFCAGCINNSIKIKKRCPTCRKRLTAKMVHPLFLF